MIPDQFSGKYLDLDLWVWIFNSIFVASWVTALQVTTSCLAAYAFSRIRWRGRNTIFLGYLATMMIPALVLTIPQFQIMVSLNWVNSYKGLIIPSALARMRACVSGSTDTLFETGTCLIRTAISMFSS